MITYEQWKKLKKGDVIWFLTVKGDYVIKHEIGLEVKRLYQEKMFYCVSEDGVVSFFFISGEGKARAINPFLTEEEANLFIRKVEKEILEEKIREAERGLTQAKQALKNFTKKEETK